MRAPRPVPTMLALAVAIGGCAGGAARLSDQDVAAIQQLVQRFPEYGLSKNWDAMSAMNAENAVWMPPNGPAREGRQSIRAFLEGFPPITEFRIAAVEVDGRGDLAFARGTFSMTTVSGTPARTAVDTGKWLLILRKQPDGSWLVGTDVWNSDAPPSP